MLVFNLYENELIDENIDAYDDTLDNQYNDGIDSFPECEDLLDNEDDDIPDDDGVSETSIEEGEQERIENEVYDELEE